MSETVARKVAAKRSGESNGNGRDLYSANGQSSPKRSKQNVDECLSFAEVTFDINIIYEDNRKESRFELIKYIVALLNSVGGVVRIDECGNDKKGITKHRDTWIQTLEQKLVAIMGQDHYGECVHYFGKTPYYYVFVRKSRRVCAQESGLKISLSRSVSNATYEHTVEILNRSSVSAPSSNSSSLEVGEDDMELDHDSGDPEDNLTNFTDGKHTEFHYGNNVSFEESSTVQFKIINEGTATLEQLLKGIDNYLPKYVSAFANGRGGHVFFGIHDDGEIKGQLVKGEEEKTEVKKMVEKVIDRRDANQRRVRIWGKPDFIPKYDKQWSVEFAEVFGGPESEQRYVVVVHIFPFNGGMFLESPLAWKVDETSGDIMKMDFDEWRNKHISVSDHHQEMLKRFECLTLEGLGKRVYQLKDMTTKFADNVFPAEKGLKFVPENFAERLKLEPHKNCIPHLEKILRREYSNTEGFVMFDKSWSGNVGIDPAPEEVICDMFVMSLAGMPQMITLASKPSEKVTQYNVNLALKLKAALVSKGGCLECFVVDAQIILINDINDKMRLLPSNCYPVAYEITQNLFTKIREALVIVLAGFESSSFNPAVGASFLYVLTPEQYKISIREDRFVVVSAPPGTGKTVVAMERIRKLQARNVSKVEILYICENKALKSFIWSELGNLCVPITRAMFMSKINQHELRTFDKVRHVVVDEAQNFRNETGENWLESILTILKWPASFHLDHENTSLYIFCDELQKIRREYCGLNVLDPSGKRCDMLAEIFPTECQLSTVIRNSIKIYKEWEKIALKQSDFKQKKDLMIAHDYQGQDVNFVDMPGGNKTEIYSKVENIILQILQEKSYKESDVAVLFNTEVIAKQFATHLKTKSNITIVGNAEEFPRKGLVVDSFRRFSGLDAPVVIAVDPSPYSRYENEDKVKILLYSRAMVEFHVISLV